MPVRARARGRRLMELTPSQLRTLYAIAVHPQGGRLPGFNGGSLSALVRRKCVTPSKQHKPKDQAKGWVYRRLTKKGIEALVTAGLCERIKESTFGSYESVKQAAACHHEWQPQLAVLFGYMLVNAQCAKCKAWWRGML